MELPRLIALDLDGTLLPDSKQISAYTREVLDRIREQGAEVTIATGKFLHLARDYAEELELETALVSLDGARLDNHNGSEVFGVELESARDVLEKFGHPEWHVFSDDGNDEMLLCSNRADAFTHATRFWAERVRTVSSVAEHLVGDPGIVAFYGPTPDMDRIEAYVKENHPQLRVVSVRSQMMGETRITLHHREASKGSGVLTLCERMGIDAADCMVFGDWLNDLPMFEVGCVNVAMANAVPEIIELADHVTDETCNEDGVARFLEKHYLAG